MKINSILKLVRDERRSKDQNKEESKGKGEKKNIR